MEEIKEIRLNQKILAHSEGVARFMARYAQKHKNLGLDPYKMYILGLLHDIGKIVPSPNPTPNNPYKDHGRTGGLLIKDTGFQYWHEIYSHGPPEDGYYSVALDILNYADLSVNSKGETVDIKDRVEDIGKRYGTESEEYKNAKKIYENLKKREIVEMIIHYKKETGNKETQKKD